MSAGPIVIAVGLPIAGVAILALWVHGRRIVATRRIEVRKAMSKQRGNWVNLLVAGAYHNWECTGRVVHVGRKSLQLDHGDGHTVMIPLAAVIEIDGKKS